MTAWKRGGGKQNKFNRYLEREHEESIIHAKNFGESGYFSICTVILAQKGQAHEPCPTHQIPKSRRFICCQI